MSDKEKLQPTPEGVLNHIKYFILVLITFIIAEHLTNLFTTVMPGVFVPLTNILDILTSPLIMIILMIILVRLLLQFIPALRITSQIPVYISSISLVILSHPLLVSITGSRFIVNWLLLDYIEFRSPILSLFIIIMYVFTGYLISVIQSTGEVDTKSKVAKYLKYFADEIMAILIVIFIVIYLTFSFISESFESLDLTRPVKIGLFYLYYMSTIPGEKET